MSVALVNTVEFAHVLDLLDRMSSPAIVDRALHAAHLSRKAVRETQGFLPYRLEARVLEHAARALGDQQLGARLAEQFDYAAYDAYARYVLCAPDLATALARGRSAYPLISPRSEIVLRETGDHVLVGRWTGLNGVIGHQHLDDGAILIIHQVLRHFLGDNWRPDWIEVTGEEATRLARLEDMTRAHSRANSELPAVALRRADLTTPNPRPPEPNEIVTLAELPVIMGARPPQSTKDMVRNALAVQFALGNLSQDAVGESLSMGRRTLQRALRVEGTSFREVKAQFIEARARALLTETSVDIARIGRSLGYDEPKSFQRAFRNWTDLTPLAYRRSQRGR